MKHGQTARQIIIELWRRCRETKERLTGGYTMGAAREELVDQAGWQLAGEYKVMH